MSRSEYRTILCPTDLSATGNCALPVALALATAGSTVHLLTVVDVSRQAESTPAWAPAAKSGRVVPPLERGREHLEALLAMRGVAEGVKTEIHVEEGMDPALAIEELAERIGADIVVMGTHGHTGLGRVLMGAVATDVVRRRRVPFLLVHDARSRQAQAKGPVRVALG